MEQNAPVIAKKVWRLVRVLYMMLRKGILKKKLMLDLNMMMKRGKIAGKALQNLMFTHRSSLAPAHLSFPPPDHYEFSCTNTPSNNYHPLSLFSFRKKHHHPPPSYGGLDIKDVNAALANALAIIHSATASPSLPGFGKSPVVRQLRITDSPFPLTNLDDDSHVDEAAEQFISNFYNDLRRQNFKASSFGSMG